MESYDLPTVVTSQDDNSSKYTKSGILEISSEPKNQKGEEYAPNAKEPSKSLFSHMKDPVQSVVRHLRDETIPTNRTYYLFLKGPHKNMWHLFCKA